MCVLSVLSCILVCASCQHPLDPGENKTWVATNPIQCLGNPWERAWLDEHDDDYDSYPRDRGEQYTIIREYYGDMDVQIFSIITLQTYDIVCCACSCAAGYTLYLLVHENDVPAMLELGYRVSAPYTK